MSAGDDHFKVGLATHIDSRRAMLQTGNHLPIIVRHTAEIGYATSLLVEAAAHMILEDKNTVGEWFRCSYDDALEAVRQAIATHNVLETEEVRPKVEFFVPHALASGPVLERIILKSRSNFPQQKAEEVAHMLAQRKRILASGLAHLYDQETLQVQEAQIELMAKYV